MSSSSRFCFNSECTEFSLQHYRPGWRLRTGDFADLCHRCASAYEQGKFCEIFHLRASGWRRCESCGKKIHCGCIVSASAYMLLDAGGIECLPCARKKVSMGPNFTPRSFLFQSPIAEKLKDLSINWNSSTGSNQISFPPPSLLSPSVLQFDLHNRGGYNYEFSQPTSKDKATAYPTEKQRGINDLIGGLMSENSKNHTNTILNNQKAGPNCNLPSCPNVNVYHPLISFKEGPCGTQLAFPVPSTTPIVKNGHSRLEGNNLWHTPDSSPLSHLHSDLNGGADSSFEGKSWNLRTHLDMPGKYQVVPRYWPTVSQKNQVLQNISKESESVVTPLFEKKLSASDTGRVGRLVVPKKAAEAFLPQISHTDGMPLKVHDPMGKEWTFQFRFWPNNNSRIYVLEGVTPCIQNMQLEAGDTVIFSRLDPERKLIMGFRKASNAQSSNQETDSNNNHDSYTNGDAEPTEMHSPSNVEKSTCIAKETPGAELSSRKKKSSMMTTRGKRQKVEKGDLAELKLTWEEAQGFILPPPTLAPSIIVIEGFEFEEYEDAPIIGKPTAGSTCSADKNALAEKKDEEAMEITEGGPSMSPKTTKHPRHKSGCTCIVCVQPPSGKGPKHDQSCSCLVCDMGKRRKRSLLLHREKKQAEKEDNAHKELKSLTSDGELHQFAKRLDHRASPLKCQIDLNFQPKKDEESLPCSDTTTTDKPLHHNDTLSSCFLPPSSSSAHIQIDKDDEGKLLVPCCFLPPSSSSACSQIDKDNEGKR